MKLSRALLLSAALLALPTAAFAVAGGLWNSLPTVPNSQGLSGNELSPSDTQLPSGVNPQTEYISTQQYRAMAYSQQVPLTGFSITVPNGVSRLLLNPAGTLATGTITMPATPVDGQEVCIFDTQTQTAVTISANTGQTIQGTALTALTANTRYCYVFAGNTTNAATANAWFRSQ